MTCGKRGVTVSRMSTEDERPQTRRVAEIVAEAGPSGILGVEIADHFMAGTRQRRDVQSWVNILLSRQLYEGKVTRSEDREKPGPGSGRTHSSYRWFITGKGMEYVTPLPEPDITPYPEAPNSRRVLEILDAAGEAGETGPVIGRHFTLDYDNYRFLGHSDNLQRRLNWANQILRRFCKRGYVEQGAKETSPYYHQVPAFRWYITDKGREYLHGGMAAGRRARREQAMREKIQRNRERRLEAEKLITQAFVDYEDPNTVPVCVRDEEIVRLRSAGCTLEAIGQVFGLTRERVRQIYAGINVGTCRCAKHAKEYSGMGWPT